MILAVGPTMSSKEYICSRRGALSGFIGTPWTRLKNLLHSRLVCVVFFVPRLPCTRNPYFERPLKIALALRPFARSRANLSNRCGVASLFSEPKNSGAALRPFATSPTKSQTAAEGRRYFRSLKIVASLCGRLLLLLLSRKRLRSGAAIFGA